MSNTITIDKAVVEQALEALRNSKPNPRVDDDEYAELAWEDHFKSISALRSALEQPQQWTDETAKVPDHVWVTPEPKRPQNCGTGFCSCIECVMEQPLDPSGGTQVSKVWWDGDKLMAQPIPVESIYKEQPQQEPDVVEFRQFLTDVHTAAGLIAHGKQSKALSERLAEAVVKYRTQKQEPVAWMMVNPTHLPLSRSLHWEPQDWHITWQAVPLYTASTAPRRLTFQEIDEVCKSVDPGEIEWLWSDLVKFARAIETRILGGKT